VGESPRRAVCWKATWDRSREGGLEHLLLGDREAESTILAFDEAGRPFRLSYRLSWDDAWRLRTARLDVAAHALSRSLELAADGEGNWRDGSGRVRTDLGGCRDIDIWPTPFTNTFPIRREPMAVGERREFAMAWASAPELTVRRMRQAYTRLADRAYLYESLDGSGFTAQLSVDADDIVLDYEGVFRRVY
jgi:uncharacterized protein